MADRVGVLKERDKQNDAQAWIEKSLKFKFTDGFAATLRDGVVLCKLLNKVAGGKQKIPRIYEGGRVKYREMENVSAFIQACRALGVPESDLFPTIDLYESKNIPQVVTCIHSLGRVLQREQPKYKGPALGAKIAKSNSRQFNHDQRYAAYGACSKWTMGSAAVMERKPFQGAAFAVKEYDHGGREYNRNLDCNNSAVSREQHRQAELKQRQRTSAELREVETAGGAGEVQRIFAGYVYKRGGFRKNWKRRWLRMDPHAPYLLQWFPSKRAAGKQRPLGVVDTRGAVLRSAGTHNVHRNAVISDLHEVKVFVSRKRGGRLFEFAVELIEEAQHWMESIANAQQFAQKHPNYLNY